MSVSMHVGLACLNHLRQLRRRRFGCRESATVLDIDHFVVRLGNDHIGQLRWRVVAVPQVRSSVIVEDDV